MYPIKAALFGKHTLQPLIGHNNHILLLKLLLTTKAMYMIHSAQHITHLKPTS